MRLIAPLMPRMEEGLTVIGIDLGGRDWFCEVSGRVGADGNLVIEDIRHWKHEVTDAPETHPRKG